MKKFSHQITLNTNSEENALCLCEIERSDPDEVYSCRLLVRSGRFAYDGKFYFENLGNVIDALTRMADSLQGEATLGQPAEESYIRFVVNANGHVTVSGLLVRIDALTQSLNFAFVTDQTVLRPLIRDLSLLSSR